MRFTADANVKQAVTSWLQILDSVFSALVHRPCCHGGHAWKPVVATWRSHG